MTTSGDVVDPFDDTPDGRTYLGGTQEITDLGRDAATGLPGALTQGAVTQWPPFRAAPVTPFMDDADSEGVFKDTLVPNQAFPTIDPRPA